jgi:chromosome segregation ATPase
MRALAFLLAAAPAAALSAEVEKNRPVSKVIKLLKDMSAQLETETEKDQEIYDKMACWCTTNDKEKTKAITESESNIERLVAAIEQNTGKSAQLTAEKNRLDQEIGASQKALDKAKAMREKQLAEFNAEEKDLIASIGSLKGATVVLSKNHNSFLQMPDDTEAPQIAMMLRHQMHKYGDALAITPSQHEVLSQFIQAPAYAPQSGEIFGILKNMKETFAKNLEELQSDEKANQASFESLKEAKTEEIASGEAMFEKKSNELASTEEQLANDKVDLKDTRTKLAADEEFLANLKEKCKQTDQEFEARTKTRQEEIAAVGKALEFLSSDEAHDLFTNTFNFVQTHVSKESLRRVQAAKALKPFPRLAAVATSVRLDAFTKVKAAIDAMVTDLKKQKEDESKHRDFCIESLNENEKMTSAATRNRDDHQAKAEQLAAEIEGLTKSIEDLTAQNAESRVQLKRAGEDREVENADFQKTVQDQRATIALLGKAVEVLKGFYEKKPAALVQQPAGFDSYENNSSGGGVIAMITQIINDSKAMQAEAVRDETDSQAAYESLVKETNKSLDANSKRIVNLKDNKSKAEGDKADTESALDDEVVTLQQLGNSLKDLKGQCDFFLKNFEVRQEALTEEVEALAQAKAILSGSGMGSDVRF